MKNEDNRFIKETIERFEKETGANVAYVAVSGSQLHGTQHENSDIDIVGLYFPSIESLIMKKEQKDIELTANEDIEIKVINIYSFIKKLNNGDSISVDLLFSMLNKDMIIKEDIEITNFFRENIKELFTKNYLGLVGFSVSQVKKYAVKSKRFNSITEILEFLRNQVEEKGNDLIIKEITRKELNDFKKLEFVNERKQDGKVFLDILGKMFETTNKVSYVIEKIISIEKEFGERVRGNKDNFDYKSLSHALRSINQVKELRRTGTLKFPLESAEELRDLKLDNRKNIDIDNLIEYIFKYQENLKLNKELLNEKFEISDKIETEIYKLAYKRYL